MTVDSETTVSAQPAPVPPAAGGAPDPAGRLLARLTVIPALLALSFLVVSFPLLLIGWFQPVPTAVLTVVAAAVIVPLGCRATDGWRGAAQGTRRAPWWTVAGLVVIAAGFGVDQALFHSQFVIITRDPGSYMEFAAWISKHGSLPIVPPAAPFGGRGTGGAMLQYASWAFYPVGSTVVPQFMAGLPMALSVGFWAGGMSGAFLVAPLLGAAGVLTFGGLAARLTGPRWALAATLALALSLPAEFTSRSTYSEPLSQILFLGGMCLLIDALRSGRRPKTLAALAGLCLGVDFLARLDGPSDMLLLIPFCGLLLLRRRPQAVPLAVGIVAGLAYGAVDAWFLTRPYLRTNAVSVKGMTVAFAAALVVTVAAVLILRRRGLPRIPPRLADAAAVLPFLAIAAFAVRPYVQTDYQKLSDAPLSLHWVYWYAGGPVIIAATVAAALLIRRCLRGQAPDWVAPLLVFGWTSAVFLYQPGITPDQPWGSRRLAPAVLPGFFLLATWLAAELTRKLRARGPGKATAQAPGTGAAQGPGKAAAWGSAVLAACCVLAIAVPPAITTFNLRYAGGLRLTADGWATDHMYAGEEPALQGMCAALPPDSSVLFVDTWDSDGLSEAVRGICGVPAASLMPVSPSGNNPKPADVKAVISRIERAGRRPVLLAQSRAQLNPYPNGTVRKIMNLKTVEDQHAMDRPPTGSEPMQWNVWMWEAK